MRRETMVQKVSGTLNGIKHDLLCLLLLAPHKWRPRKGICSQAPPHYKLHPALLESQPVLAVGKWCDCLLLMHPKQSHTGMCMRSMSTTCRIHTTTALTPSGFTMYYTGVKFSCGKATDSMMWSTVTKLHPNCSDPPNGLLQLLTSGQCSRVLYTSH